MSAGQLMLRHLVCGGVVEHDQAVDGDADLAVDQKWIHIDRGDAVAGIRHQIGEADQRFHGDWYLAPRMRRLGQIEERRGNKQKAIAYYERFVELWRDCDPELRPQVDEATARLSAMR